jgi:hypothetical protein
MTDSLLPTARLVADADRYIRTPNRIALLDTRNKLRGRVAELERRLEDGDRWLDEMPRNRKWYDAEEFWLELLHQYEAAHDALARADAAL